MNRADGARFSMTHHNNRMIDKVLKNCFYFRFARDNPAPCSKTLNSMADNNYPKPSFDDELSSMLQNYLDNGSSPSQQSTDSGFNESHSNNMSPFNYNYQSSYYNNNFDNYATNSHEEDLSSIVDQVLNSIENQFPVNNQETCLNGSSLCDNCGSLNQWKQCKNCGNFINEDTSGGIHLASPDFSPK